MSENKQISEFKRLYSEVFDKEGEIKACGRDTCYDLIKVADEIETDVSHGNLESCTMEVETIHKLAVQLIMET